MTDDRRFAEISRGRPGGQPDHGRSQFLGGMTTGLGMALAEESTVDHRFGDHVNDDLARVRDLPIRLDKVLFQ